MTAELSITSNFTFLTGASHPEEHMARAALLGLSAIAIADENSVAGIVRAYTAAREIAREVRLRRTTPEIGPPRPAHIPHPGGVPILNTPRLIPAARITLESGFTATALPRDRKAWARLCRLISTGRLRAEKGSCLLHLDDLLEWGPGLELLLHPPQAPTAQPGAGEWHTQAERLSRRFPGACHLLMAPAYDGQDAQRFRRLAKLAETLGIDTVASATPILHHGRRKKLADVLTAIRQGVRVDDLGRAALANGEQRLRSEPELRRIFKDHEDALDRTDTIASRCTFDLGELRYEYPSEVSNGEAPRDRLSRLAHEDAPDGSGRIGRLTLSGLLHEGQRIGRLAVHEHLEMQMRRGGAARRATQRNDLALSHRLPEPDERRGGVTVQRRRALSVIEHDETSIHGVFPYVDDDSPAGCADVRVGGDRDVEARVVSGISVVQLLRHEASLGERPHGGPRGPAAGSLIAVATARR